MEKPFAILPNGVQNFYPHKLPCCFFLSLLFIVVTGIQTLYNRELISWGLDFPCQHFFAIGVKPLSQTLAPLRRPVLLQFSRCRTGREPSQCYSLQAVIVVCTSDNVQCPFTVRLLVGLWSSSIFIRYKYFQTVDRGTAAHVEWWNMESVTLLWVRYTELEKEYCFHITKHGEKILAYLHFPFGFVI